MRNPAGAEDRDPNQPELMVDDRQEDITHMAPGWAGACTVCGHKKWVPGGWATFWTLTGEVKGWHGWGGAHAEECEQGCQDPFWKRPRVIEPLHLDEQRPYIAAWALGGEAAVLAMFPKPRYKRRGV